ncbi:class II aldolase/adducin family protein [bacterium]|nr:class II aldolase/adducin family protein [bacterium]
MSEEGLKRTLIEAGRRLDDRGLICAAEGNLSVRLEDGTVLITASGSWKGLLTDDDFVVINLDGVQIRGEGRASSETAAHLEVYKTRHDINSVIHAHAPHCTALTLADISLEAVPLPEAAYLFGSVPTCRFAVPGTPEGGEVVREWIGRRDAILLDRHGALTVGRTVDQALARMESLETVAMTFWRALQTGHDFRRPTPEEVERTVQAALGAGVHEDAIRTWKERMLEQYA